MGESDETSLKSQSFAPRAVVGGATLRFGRVVPGAGSAEDVILCSADDGKEFVVLASEWPRRSANITTRSSPSSQKIALFRSLFRGRPDAYASGYLRKDGHMGYGPACSNLWKTGLCDRRHVKCSECPNRSLHAPDDRTLIKHFVGADPRRRDVLGLYPMTQDSTCWLLVADFDGDGWQEAASAYRDACHHRGLFCAVERSRSGNGAHVWMFFQQEVPAVEARTLGTLLLDDARRHCSKIGFDSYDRLFPTQDTITSDGLGNLIALPLQGAAVREGNSVFVDDDFRPFDDQWAFLSSVERVPASTVHELAENYVAPETLGIGRNKSHWSSKKGMAVQHDAVTADFMGPQDGAVATYSEVTKAAAMPGRAPLQVDVTLDGMVQLRKNQLSQPMVADLSSLAAMANPEFLLKQRMHQKIYPKTTPRYLWFGEENDNELRLPRGCQSVAMSYLRECGCQVDVHDRRTLGRTIHASFVGTLRAGQSEAIGALAQYDDGMLVAPTGFGKTVIAADLIANKGVSTLVLVPSSSLLDQWRKSLGHFLRIDDEPPVLLTPTGRKKKNQPGKIGVIGGGKKLPSGIVDIALVSSLMQSGKVAGDRQVSNLVSRYGMVLVDEAQHVPASGLVEVLKHCKAKYVYGLTATPHRKDKLDRAIQMFLGPVRLTVKLDAKERAQLATRVLVSRFTGIRPPADVDPADWNGLLDVVCGSDQRNAQIADDAYASVAQGRYPLVLTRRVDHARTLAGLIQKRLNECYRPKKRIPAKGIPTGKSPVVITLVGSDDQKTRRERLSQIRNLPADQPACIVATDSYVGEGFDEPRLDTLLLAAPVAWEGLLTQLVGRIQREMPGKADVYVYDYVDELVPLFARQWHGRLKAYAKLGYVVRDVGSDAEPSHIVTAGPAATAVLQNDIQRAREKIVLFSAWVVPKAVAVMEPALCEALARGVEVLVVVPAKEGADGVQACLDRLEQMGCKVSRTPGKIVNAAVFDDELVWFGGIPPLAFAHSGDCSIRIVNRELAGELARE